MIAMRLSEINQVLQGHLIGADPEINAVSIDTRTLQAGDLYIAIKGAHFDGNDFVERAQTAGAAAVILQKDCTTSLPKILLGDTQLALGRLAAAVRRKANIALVAITGSNGKTTVKEMLAAILSVHGKVLFTQGNLNNAIGVPLTLLRLHAQHQFAVVEMGANHPGEIRYTSQLANPDIAVMNNVGAAHIAGFGDIEGVAQAKAELLEALPENGIAILNADDRFFDFWCQQAGNRTVVAFGLNARAEVTARAIQQHTGDVQFMTAFELFNRQGSITIQLQLAGVHNVVNALAASAAAQPLGIGLAQIKQGLEAMQPVAGRLQILSGELGNRIINDSYNANPSSLKAALDVLAEYDTENWVVLGAFGELGDNSREMHEDMAELIKSKAVARLLAVGPETEFSVRKFGAGATFFATQAELIATLQRELQGHETVLIKGSRAQHMENVVQALLGKPGE